MTTNQIARIFYAHTRIPDKEARRRLLRLWEKHVLNRTIEHSLAKAGLPIQMVYMLGKAGRLLLREGEVDDRPIPERQGTKLLVHNVLIGEALAAIIEALRTLEAKWEVSYFGEQLESFQWQDFRVKMRPDGYLVLSSAQGRELSFLIEMDTGSRPLQDYVKKVKQYDWYFQSGVWRHDETSFPAIVVLVWKLPRDDEDPPWDDLVRASEKRLADVMERVRSLRKEPKVRWFFVRLDQIGGGDWHTLSRSGTLQRVRLFDSLAEVKSR
jgi:hypothetical protein